MLIAPIFHNSYHSPKGTEPQAKQSDVVSPSSPSTKISESSASSKYNNIFKSAFNRSISFFSKITTSSGSPSTTTSTSSKPARSETNHDSNSSSTETPSDCSSPDSLKTEMIFFKPIIREPKTPSNAKPVLLRIPSIRSTASSTDPINSPCPSPFFIPITPRRQSAFSFVSYAEEDSKESESQLIVKPKPTKRKTAKLSSPQKPAAKRLKYSPKSNNLRLAAETTSIPKAEKTSKLKAKPVLKPKVEPVVVVRRTRAMDKKNVTDELPEPTMKAPEILPLQKTGGTGKQKLNKTPPTAVPKRVTRSNSLKH